MSRPYSAQTADLSLQFLSSSKDSKKITPNDIKIKLEHLQPNLKSLQPKLSRLLISGTEDVNREGVSNLMNQLQRNCWDWHSIVGENDGVANEALSVECRVTFLFMWNPRLYVMWAAKDLKSPRNLLKFIQLFIMTQFFQPNGGPITRDELRRMAALFSPYGLPWKEDVDTLLKLFDKDGDGVIGVEDFKAMALPNAMVATRYIKH